MKVKTIIVSVFCLSVSVGLAQTNKPVEEQKSGSSIGSFFRAINNAGKSASSVAKKTDENLKDVSKTITKLSNTVEGYAPDSLKQTKKDSLKISKTVKPKQDTLKKKKLTFEEIF